MQKPLVKTTSNESDQPFTNTIRVTFTHENDKRHMASIQRSNSQAFELYRLYFFYTVFHRNFKTDAVYTLTFTTSGKMISMWNKKMFANL